MRFKRLFEYARFDYNLEFEKINADNPSFIGFYLIYFFIFLGCSQSGNSFVPSRYEAQQQGEKSKSQVHRL